MSPSKTCGRIATCALTAALIWVAAPGATLTANEHRYEVAQAAQFQSRLTHLGTVANGEFDLRLSGFADPDGVEPVDVVWFDRVHVRNGKIDLPVTPTTPEPLWWELSIRSPHSGPYTPVGLRQRLSRGGLCVINQDVEFNDGATVGTSAAEADLVVTCCNDVDTGGQLRIDGFLQALLVDSNELQATDLGGPADLMLNADGGNVGVGVSAPGAGLHLPAGPDITPSSGGSLVAGGTGTANLAIDDNEIMARVDGSASRLNLNRDGGDVRLGGQLDVGLQVITQSPSGAVAGATCPSGTRLIGGGCSSTVDVIDSYPFSLSTWSCRFDVPDIGFWTGEAYAICARVK